MRILGIKVSGFALLEKDFTLDLRTLAKVNSDDREDEVESVLSFVDCPRTYAFVGKNASGKSTILRLITLCYEYLGSNYFPYSKSFFKGDHIFLEIVFVKDKSVFKRTVTLLPPHSFNMGGKPDDCCSFKDETFWMRSEMKKKSDDLFDGYTKDPKTDNPFSAVPGIAWPFAFDNPCIYSKSSERTIGLFSASGWSSFFALSPPLRSSLVHLLDESIESLSKPNGSDDYLLKRVGEDEAVLNPGELSLVLSDGTIRGIELFTNAILAIKGGKTYIIDEIEGSFHKNLISNIIFLFNDAEINTKKASLIFSTHYSGLLDAFRRRDGIFVCSKGPNGIGVKNVYDFDIRTELSKSGLFDNNAFGTLANYDLLMAARDEIRNEIRPVD